MKSVVTSRISRMIDRSEVFSPEWLV